MVNSILYLTYLLFTSLILLPILNCQLAFSRDFTGKVDSNSAESKNNKITKVYQMRTIDDFKKLKKGMPVEQVLKELGKPDQDLGSGIHIYSYGLSDNSTMRLGCTNVLLYVDHIQKNGKTIRLIGEGMN